MKFYMTPGSCSTGIHILLEEAEQVFEVHVVNLMKGEHNRADYLALNPKATVPVLLLKDGTALTDFFSIAWWLARCNPRTGLLPDSIEDETRIIDVMSYVVGTIHMQGFARIFTTDRFAASESEHEWARQQGRTIIEKGFLVIDGMLSETGYVVQQFTIADAALFYVEFWAIKTGMALPPACYRHYQLMLQRRAVRQVLYEEGYGSDL